MVTLSALSYKTFPTSPSQYKDAPIVAIHQLDQTMEEYLQEVRSFFEGPLQCRKLFNMSERLQEEFHQRLQSSDVSMLPSYHHTLPTGQESGVILALDVGGSNFRIALVQLVGKDGNDDGMHIMRNSTFPIDDCVRDLQGPAFFDWMAEKVQEMLGSCGHDTPGAFSTLPMGVAWSFPFEQTSTRSGSLLTMGKGFCATHGCESADLWTLFMTSCNKKGVHVQMQTIVNDSTSTLLSQAYRDPSTRISLILGTGINSAIHLPVSALASDKYGERPQSWHAAAQYVLVNTELSMFGEHVFPVSRWDEHLNATHALPGYQPLEHKVGGRYLGEIVRLILVEAIQKFGLFDGCMPARLNEPYALETGTMGQFESDQTDSLRRAANAFALAHPSSHSPTMRELRFIKRVAQAVSRRAAAYVATAVHALWSLRAEAEPTGSIESQQHVTIACNGSVMEKYPGFRAECQRNLDELIVISGAQAGSVTLQMAPESSVFGAAVAVACLEDEETS